MAIVMVVTAVVISGVALVPDNGDGSGWQVLVLLLLVLAAPLGTIGGFAWREGTTGQSPGKRAVGIKVWRVDGTGPIGGWKGLARRTFAVVISAQTLFGLGFVWMLWDRPRRQTLHDKSVDSVVVRI